MNTKGHISNPNEKEKEKRDSIPKRSRISLKSHLPAIPCICTFISFGKHEPVLGFPYGFVCIFETSFSSSSFASCKNASTAVNHSGDCALSATERTVFFLPKHHQRARKRRSTTRRERRRQRRRKRTPKPWMMMMTWFSSRHRLSFLLSSFLFEVTNKKKEKKWQIPYFERCAPKRSPHSSLVH